MIEVTTPSDNKFTIVTQGDGTFVLEGLPDGTYKIKPIYSGRFSMSLNGSMRSLNEASVFVKNSVCSAKANIGVMPAGELTVFVVLNDGVELPTEIRLVGVDPATLAPMDRYAVFFRELKPIKRRNAFGFNIRRIPEGRYLVSFIDRKGKRHYYPALQSGLASSAIIVKRDLKNYNVVFSERIITTRHSSDEKSRVN